MYVCVECGYIFNSYKINNNPCVCFGFPCSEKTKGCPKCGGSFTEAIKCNICREYIDGDYVELDNGSCVCDSCYRLKNIKDLGG